MKTKTYKELSRMQTIEERFEYLNERGRVGHPTFGSSRYLNQTFYKSPEWKRVRRDVIARDNGNDMGLDGYPIEGRIIVHHLNAVTEDMILNRDPSLLDPNNLVCVSHKTHEAITYGSKECLPEDAIERHPDDTTLWR